MLNFKQFHDMNESLQEIPINIFTLRHDNDILITVNINKLMAKFKKDKPEYYVERGNENDLGRIDRFKEHIKKVFKNPSKHELSAPLVYFVNGKLNVSDGRHRIAAWKEMGYDKITIEIDPSDLGEAEKLC